jgi:hypothetical protein
VFEFRENHRKKAVAKMYRTVDGREDAELGSDDENISPPQSEIWSPPPNYLGALGHEREQVELSEGPENTLLDSTDPNTDATQREFEAKQSRPLDDLRWQGNPWSPGVWVRIPWLGLLAMILNILC